MSAQQPRSRLVLRFFVVCVLVAATFVTTNLITAPPATAAPCDAPVVNKVACENTRPGTPNWQAPYRDDTILGYTTDISVTPGGQVQFKMLTSAPAYRLDIFRLGWYGGVGARQVGTESMSAIFTGTPSVEACTARTLSTAIATWCWSA